MADALPNPLDHIDYPLRQSKFDANTILAATADNSPAAVTVGEQTILGRVTGGNVAALTVNQSMLMLGVHSPWHLPMLVGGYYAPTGGFGAAILAEAIEIPQLIIPRRDCTVDRLAVYMTIAGSAGAVVRLGLRAYSMTAALPGALIVDGGTADATGAAGALEVAISQPLVAGTPYVVTCTVQGSASTRPTLIAGNSASGPWAHTAPTANVYPNVRASGTTGALASPTATWGALSTQYARIWLRASA